MGVHELEKYIRQFFGVAADDLEKISHFSKLFNWNGEVSFLRGEGDPIGWVLCSMGSSQ